MELLYVVLLNVIETFWLLGNKSNPSKELFQVNVSA